MVFLFHQLKPDQRKTPLESIFRQLWWYMLWPQNFRSGGRRVRSSRLVSATETLSQKKNLSQPTNQNLIQKKLLKKILYAQIIHFTLFCHTFKSVGLFFSLKICVCVLACTYMHAHTCAHSTAYMWRLCSRQQYTFTQDFICSPLGGKDWDYRSTSQAAPKTRNSRGKWM